MSNFIINNNTRPISPPRTTPTNPPTVDSRQPQPFNTRTNNQQDTVRFGDMEIPREVYNNLANLLRLFGIHLPPLPPGPTPPGPTPPGPTPPGPTPPGPTPPGPTPPGPTPPGPTPPGPTAVNLTTSEQNILNSLYGTDASGNVQTGTVSAFEGNTGIAGLSVGDQLVVTDTNGQQTAKTLSAQDLYDIRFRENVFATVNSIGSGWQFTPDLVKINGGQLQQPEQRQYQAPNGAIGVETVVERNDLWEVVERSGTRFLLMRTTDDNGNPVRPSDAINDIFNNRSAYQFDCASPMPLVNLKATLDTIGEDDFNRNAGQLLISTWYDQYDNTGFDGGFSSNVRVTTQDGEIVVNGTASIAGETQRFDPNQGDALRIGSTYYFDLPGDRTTAVQGWNGIYMGKDESGNHQFWTSSIGVARVKFPDDGSWIPTPGSSFQNYYLGAAIGSPNHNRLQAWDNDGSVAR